MIKIALIGGGATNLFLAALLSKENVQVDIFEIRDRVGKKILETGNGKCNFTNLNIKEIDYNNESFVKNIINKDILNTFKEFGLIYYSDNEGRCYPHSDASNTILDLLRSKYINNPNFNEYVNTSISSIEKINNKYKLSFNNESKVYDYVVIGIGSKVNNKLFTKLNLNLKVIDYAPSLCPLNINVKSLKGIRVKCIASLLDSNKEIYSEKGEIIFKENGISGISIFNISFYLNKYKINNPILSLDLFPNYSKEDLLKLFINKIDQDPQTFFIGLTNKMIGQYLIKKLNLINKVSKKDLDKIINELKNLSFKIEGLLDNPQVAKGGISIDEINDNLELKKYKNIYVGGECIDIDGKCGGYNLHFAFSCAIHIYQELINKLCTK